jgi:hypothetical protein
VDRIIADHQKDLEMNSKSRLVVFWLMGLSCLLAQPLLASTYIPCDGCSALQMTNAAITQGVGRYIVGNVLQKTVEALRIYSGSHVNVVATKAGAKTLYVDHVDMTDAEISAFSSYVKFYNAVPVGYHKQFNLVIVGTDFPANVPNSVSAMRQRISADFNGGVSPMSAPAPDGGSVSYPIPGVTAYTVVDGGPAQNAFLEWVGGLTMYGISDTITFGLQSLSIFHVTNTDHLPEVAFAVTFTDGSHIGVYVDITQQPPQLVVNQKTAVDSHGNTIPASYAAVAGTGKQRYDFSGGGNGSDIVNMHRQIHGFGIDLSASSRYECYEYFSNGISEGVRCGMN